MTFLPTSNITEQIADHLSWEIAAGRLPGRTRIQELKLAKELNVSRGSVREALLVLQGRHMVDIVPRKGASVRELKQSEVQGFTVLFSDLLGKSIASLRKYPAALGSAALENLCAAAKAEDVEAVVRAREDYLQQLVCRSGETYLRRVLQPLLRVSSRVGLVASKHRDFDARDSFRYCSGLHTALSHSELDRVTELINAFSRRECQLASHRLN